MKTLTNPDHFTFTNHFGGPHFNKSLLKTRIEMMNKPHKTWKTVGKYFLFVPVLFIVFSFSKPYLIANNQTKYLIQTDDAIEWVITPKITMKDLTKIQEAIEAHGGTFEVTSYQLDPLQLYVQRMETRQSTEKSAGSSHYGNPYSLRPIMGDFLKLDLKTNKIIHYIRKSPLADLQKVVLEDRAEAEKAYNENALEYELREKQIQIGTFWENIQYLTVTSFPENQSPFFRVLLGKSTSVWKDRLSGAEILKEALKHPSAITRVNRHPIANEDLAQLDPKTIKDAFIFDIYDEKKDYAKKTYVLVHTNL
ncbi:hypothetical protein GVN20_16770 [Runella sp. CRIBMP]|uniref:hypothetical protein n=1 Tax=Runella sp. CRIBMP TaxID=2683261 RepID=UPI0014123EA9|nr:hypothetical protein [Runella sp. CRIBMP]NBB21022.1 hypothetical protein [Runella sp. CRIBMP]